MDELLDKLYQEAEEYADGCPVPDRFLWDIEAAFRAGAKYGFRLAQERPGVLIQSLQG